MFTVNFGEDSPEEQLTPLEDNWEAFGVKYAIWQLEVGENGTPHLQGYLELANGKSMSAVHAIPGLARAALFERKGSAQQAIAYCSKEDSRVDGPWTFGTPSSQG